MSRWPRAGTSGVPAHRELARNEVFNDEITALVPSYDGRTNKEPITLPCKLPLLLMLGTEGIAVRDVLAHPAA